MDLVKDILEFNRIRRMAYERIIAQGTSHEVAQNAVCLLLWMEAVLSVKLLHEVAKRTTSDAAVMWLVLEADAVHDFVLHGYDLPEDLEGVPSLVAMCGGRLVDFRFFRFHRDLVARGLAVLRDGVPALIFDEGLQAMMRENREAAGDPGYTPPPELTAPYVVMSRTPPQDSRSAFIFFVGGQPINTEEITAYFNEVWEGCIESVAAEDAGSVEEGETPYHGIIVFADAIWRDTVMDLENSASFDINGKGMWVQAYQPPN